MAQQRSKVRYKKKPTVQVGRKPGTTPFLKDKKRFHAVLVGFLRRQFLLSKDRSIDASIMILDSTTSFKITAFPGGIAEISDAHLWLESRWEYLDDTCDALLAAGFDSKESAEWIQDSWRALSLYVHDFYNIPAAFFWLAILKALGWEVERILKKFGGPDQPILAASAAELREFRANKAQSAKKRQQQITAVSKNLSKVKSFMGGIVFPPAGPFAIP